MPGEVCFLRALTARQLDRMADETLDWTALSLLKLASRGKKTYVSAHQRLMKLEKTPQASSHSPFNQA